MPNYRQDTWRLALAIAFLLAIAWSPYLFFGKTLLASASDAASIYPVGAKPTSDSNFHLYRSLDSGAPAWQNEPWLALQHRLIFDEHAMPMWDPYDGYGAPFAASMIAQPFYPLTLAVSIDPTPWTYNLLVVGRLFILAFGCALFVRLFTGFLPALVAGVCAAFSGYFIVYVDIVHIGVEVMLPWILLGVELVVRRAGPRSAGLLAAAWGVSLLGGMPESSALAAVVVGFYALFRVCLERHDRGTFKRLGWLVSGIGVGTAIAGIMLVPFLEYLHRDHDQHQSNPTGLAFDPFQSRLLLTEFAPLALGPPVNYILTGFGGFSGFRGGPGTFAIFLAVVASVTAVAGNAGRTLGDRVALFLTLAAVGFEAKRFGVPIVQWVGALPLLHLTNFPKYGEADIAVCIACAAGLGVAAILERRVGFWQLLSAFTIILGLVTWLSGGIVIPPNTPQKRFYYFGFALLFLILGLSALVAAYAARTKRTRLAGRAFLGLALLEGAFALFVPMYYVVDKPAPDSRNPFVAAPFVDYLKHATAPDAGRIVGTGNILFPDWSSAFGLYDTRALSAMYPERYLAFIDAFVSREKATADDQFDRFTGTRQIDFGDPLVRRWMTLSSINYIVSARSAPPSAGANAILHDLWDQNKATITPARQAAVRLTTAEIDGVAENALFDHPPDDTISYQVNLRPGFAWFAVDVALDPDVWTSGCGGAVTFALDARDLSGNSFARATKTIDPKHLIAHRHWNRLTLDIRTAKAAPVTLHFATSVPPPGDICSAWALWGEPRWTATQDLQPFKNTRHQSFTRVPEVPNAFVYRVDQSLPRLSLFHTIVSAASGEDALHTIVEPAFDAKRTLVVEGDLPVAAGPAGRDSVTVVDRTSQRIEADVTAASNAVLLQNDTWYPGWRATVDGNETPILRADYLFRAIAIPAGRHHVLITYRPQSAAVGLALSVLGLLALSAMLTFTPAFRKSIVRAYSTRRAKA